jgi:dihydroxyacetone kinase-like protein
MEESMSLTAKDVLAWITACAQVIAENREWLIELDAAIGDADHGANMDRGFKAVLAKLPELDGKDIGTILKTVGMTLVSTVGGAGGPLYGTFFLQAGMTMANKMELTPQDWLGALEAGVQGVQQRGKAEPAVEALRQSLAEGLPFNQALLHCSEAAEKGMKDTIPLVARKGRASYLGERSAGHQDPGATSSYLILKAASEAWGDHSP